MATDEMSEVDPWQLVQAISEWGKYAFLLGAGTSRPEPSGIKTAGELIDDWQEECYDKADPEEDFEEWVQQRENEEMDYDQGEYGFWFEKRHPTRGERRQRIDDLVRDADPTPGHITLASMMSEGYVPHILTPNFDDLIFDAFYLFLEDKPNLIDHRAVAPEFKLTREDPTIVKLHGDYLYDNLQNTDSETQALKPAMRDALQQTVTEYGLVVVGYGGTDESIMEPMLDADISEYGIYWCVRNKEDISPKVGELLEQPNTHLVEIEGFLSLMETFYRRITDVELPEPEDLHDRAENRAELLEWTLEESTESAEDGGDGAFDDVFTLVAAQRAIEKEQFSHGIELINEVLEESELPKAYVVRGIAKHELERYEEAIEDYNQAIDLDSEGANIYYNRGNAKVELERYEEAIEDYNRAVDFDSEDPEIYYNRGNSKFELERYDEALDDYNQAIDLNSEQASFYNNRGNSKAKLERYEEALNDYNQAIQLNPEKASYYNNRGSAKADLERYEEAIDDYDQAIDLDKKYVDAYTNRGISKMNLERYDAAIDDYTKAINKGSSKHLAGYQHRAEARLVNEEFKSALDDALEAKSASTATENLAVSLLLELIARVLLEENHVDEEEEYRSLCSEEFNTTWEFENFDAWLDNRDVEPEKEIKIEEFLDLIREHQK